MEIGEALGVAFAKAFSVWIRCRSGVTYQRICPTRCYPGREHGPIEAETRDDIAQSYLWAHEQSLVSVEHRNRVETFY